MNGEQRDAASTAADRPTVAPTTSKQGDQPLLEAIDVKGISKTTIVKEEDIALAPLFTQDAAADFRSRWDTVQKSFVDDPKDAVQAADELVAEVTQSLSDTFVNQRSELEQCLEQTEAPTTERLRVALRQYRSFFDRLLTM